MDVAPSSDPARRRAPPARKRPLPARVMGVLRVMVYACVAFTAIGLFAARAVLADVGEAALSLGRDLAGLGDTLGEPYRVKLNGEVLHVGSTMVDAEPAAVLDRFEAACRDGEVGLGETMTALAAATKRSAPSRADLLSLGIVRREAGGEGMIACLARSGANKSAGDLVARLRSFSESGDLGDVGKLRYVYVRKGASRTQVVAVWTDGAFHLFHVVPLHGEEPPGSDSPDVPRPDGAKRLLTAELDGVPWALRIYDAPGSVDDQLAALDRAMPARGWMVARAAAGAIPSGRSFEKDGATLIATAQAHGDRALVTTLQTAP